MVSTTLSPICTVPGIMNISSFAFAGVGNHGKTTVAAISEPSQQYESPTLYMLPFVICRHGYSGFTFSVDASWTQRMACSTPYTLSVMTRFVVVFLQSK